jgi:hypothetical protein
LILDSSLTLEAVLGGAVAANQPEFHVDYFVRDNNANQTLKPATLRGALNDTTDVTLISPTTGRYSTQGFVAEVTRASIYNKDTGSVTVTVKTTDGSTDRIVCKATLATTETLIYTNTGEWYVMTADGAFKNDSIAYAEFTWTPVLTFATAGDLSVAYSSRIGTGIKVGSQVTGFFDIQTSAFTHTTASGLLNITGFSYTSKASPAQTYRGELVWQGITKANYTDASCAVAANSSTILAQMSGSGQTLATLAAGDLPTGGSVILIGSITIQV